MFGVAYFDFSTAVRLSSELARNVRFLLAAMRRSVLFYRSSSVLLSIAFDASDDVGDYALFFYCNFERSMLRYGLAPL
jgi:hypothetical protein